MNSKQGLTPRMTDSMDLKGEAMRYLCPIQRLKSDFKLSRCLKALYLTDDRTLTMATRFLLYSDDYVDDPIPRVCTILRSNIKSDAGQNLIQVAIEPPLSIDVVDERVLIDQLLLGQIDSRLTLADVGDRPFMVDIYIHTRGVSSDHINTKELERIGCGLLKVATNSTDSLEPNKGHARTMELEVPAIRFLREQYGVPEQAFKAKLVSIFDQRELRGDAYLVQVHYPRENEYSVALCFCGLAPDQELVSDAAKLFYEMFGINEHLDTAFLSMEQEASIQTVARPFYEKKDVAEKSKMVQ